MADRRMTRLRRLMLAAACVGLIVSIAPTATATATVAWQTKSVRFTVPGTYWVAKQGMCVVPHFTGRISYSFRTHHYQGDPHTYFDWRNPRLVDPRISVHFTSTCSSQFPPSRVKAADAQLSGRVYGGGNTVSCSLNPSLSLSFPWGVSVAATPECGNTKTTGKLYGRANPTNPQYAFAEETTGIVALWGKSGKFDTFHDAGRYPVHCFRIRYSVKTWRSHGGTYSGILHAIPGERFCINLHTLGTS